MPSAGCRRTRPCEWNPGPAPPVVLIQSWNELQEGAILVPTDQDGYSYGQAIAQAVGIPWTPPPKHTLRVAPSSRGTVTSTPAGISCPPTCATQFDEGLQVTLTARPTHGSLLDHWRGCTDTDPTCSVVLVRDSTARPVFLATLQRRTLSLRLSGHLVARGRLSVRDGFSSCASYEQVRIQRRRGRGWRSVTSTQTDDAGRYTVNMRDRPGAYRARAARDSLEGHTCLITTSRTVNYGPLRGPLEQRLSRDRAVANESISCPRFEPASGLPLSLQEPARAVR
jgi:hypothetical protein